MACSNRLYPLYLVVILVAFCSVFVATVSAATRSSANTTITLPLPNSIDELDSLITIGTGTSTMQFPFNGNQRNTRTGMLYTASEIGIGAGTITSVAFYASASYTYTGGIVKLWMKETTDTGLTVSIRWDSLVSGATMVDSIAVTSITSGWNTLTLQTPFVYSGQHNLLIGASSYVTAVSGTNSSWLRTPMSAPNMCVGISSAVDPWPDTTQLTSRTNRPNIRMDIDPYTITTMIVGTVRDSSAEMSPIVGATVVAGSHQTTTDSSGNYSLTVALGFYNINVTATCFTTGIMNNVEADSGIVDTVDFYLMHPEISVDPTSVELLATPGSSVSTTVVLSNSGNADLTWRAQIMYGEDLLRAHTNTPRIKIHNRTMEADTAWGEDGFGYIAYDNTDPRWSSTWTYQDITALGSTVIPQNANAGAKTYMDGFHFFFYGAEWDSIWVSTEGFVQFINGNGSINPTNMALPTTGAANPENGIYPLWDDLTSAVLKYYDATNNVFIVQWNAIRSGGPVILLTRFQLKLFAADNKIVFLYSIVQPTAMTPTIGIQNLDGAAQHYLQCYYLSTAGTGLPNPMNNTGIAFENVNPNGAWLTVSPTSGTVVPHDNIELFVQATLSDSDTVAEHSATIRISNNSCNTIDLPVTCTITSIRDYGTTLPGAYKLHQNYPNPFNPTTEIRFDLLQAGFTKLAVYDVLGREVTKLVERQMRPGYYSARFDASRLATGVYFYRIESGNYRAVKKMVLVK